MKKLSTFLMLFVIFFTNNTNAQENAFTVDFSGFLNTIDLSTGATTPVAAITPTFGGMDFGPDNILYGLDYNSNQLFEVDTSDASTTLIGSSVPPSTHIWTGMAYDEGTGIMYAIASDGTASGSANLYTIDLSDGSISLVGSQGDATAIACIGIDDNGQMYGLLLSAVPKIYAIDKSDGSVTLIGNVNEFGGAGMGYGMDFNTEDQTMYLTAYDSFTFNNDLYTVNLSTGAVTQVGSLGGWTYALAIVGPFSSDFVADETLVCSGSTVNFTDASSGADTWSWTFEGGTPSTSTDQNPSVVYSSPGVYDVSLTITNSLGDSDTETKSDYITVIETPAKADAPDGADEVCTDNYYEYSTDEVLYAESYEWELSPSDAGTLTPNLYTATLQTASDWTGDFTIRVRATNMCNDGEWSDNTEVTLSQSPEEFALEGGGSYCLGDDGVEITLDGSQADVEYELYLDGTATGITVEGTGSPISFGLVTDEGYYEAVGSNENCSFTMQNQIEVSVAYPPLEPETPVGPETVCNEPSSDYTSEGTEDADSYVWTLSPDFAGTINENGLEATVTWDTEFAGIASISLSGINDCGEGNPSEVLEVSVGAPNPEVTGENEVCDFSDEMYEVTSNEGSTYTWEVTGGTISEGQGTNMITVAWDGVGLGSVMVTEETSDGCSGTSSEFAVTIDDCTGIFESKEEFARLSPNPADNLLFLNSNTGISEIAVYSLEGKLILLKEINAMSKKIDISEIEAGLYMVRIKTIRGVYLKKIIIK